MSIKTEVLTILHNEDKLELFCAFPEDKVGLLPAMMIFPNWYGRSQLFCQIAESFANKGFIGIAVDLFGSAKIGSDRAMCQRLISPFIENRLFLKSRLTEIVRQIQKDNRIDSQKISAAGYCFGGLCVLDMVRNNMGLRAGISIHGLLGVPHYELPKRYQAKVLVFHGYKDPMTTPNQKGAFEAEMNAANADWQLLSYGKGYHSFTTPDANDVSLGTVYDPVLDERTTRIIDSFLSELK